MFYFSLWGSVYLRFYVRPSSYIFGNRLGAIVMDLKSVGIDSFGGILDLSENLLFDFGFNPRLPDGALFLVEYSENFT